MILSNIEFIKLIVFNGSSINNLTISNIKYVQTADFSNNEIQTVNLDGASHIGEILFEGNPLLPETKGYLDSLTDLNVTY